MQMKQNDGKRNKMAPLHGNNFTCSLLLCTRKGKTTLLFLLFFATLLLKSYSLYVANMTRAHSVLYPYNFHAAPLLSTACARISYFIPTTSTRRPCSPPHAPALFRTLLSLQLPRSSPQMTRTHWVLYHYTTTSMCAHLSLQIPRGSPQMTRAHWVLYHYNFHARASLLQLPCAVPLHDPRALGTKRESRRDTSERLGIPPRHFGQNRHDTRPKASETRRDTGERIRRIVVRKILLTK